MTHQQRETNNSDASSNDTLAQQIHDLRSEVAVLSKLISTQLEGENDLREDHPSDQPNAKDPKYLLGSKELKKFLQFVEDYANEEPNKAMALATTVGFLVGLFVSRGRRQ